MSLKKEMVIFPHDYNVSGLSNLTFKETGNTQRKKGKGTEEEEHMKKARTKNGVFK